MSHVRGWMAMVGWWSDDRGPWWTVRVATDGEGLRGAEF
jgi:hypothetical protein